MKTKKFFRIYLMGFLGFLSARIQSLHGLSSGKIIAGNTKKL